jgi:hypothetical protein
MEHMQTVAEYVWKGLSMEHRRTVAECVQQQSEHR